MKGKKVLSAFIALVLIAGLPVAAFADTWDIANGNITITATPTENGDSQTVSQGETSKIDNAPTISQTAANRPTTPSRSAPTLGQRQTSRSTA